MDDLNAAPTAVDTPADETMDAIDAVLDADFDAFMDGDEATPENADTPQEPAEPGDAPEGDPDTDAPADAGDDDTDTTDEADADQPDPGDDAGAPEPPTFWDAKGRELFKTLPPEAQAYLSKREAVLQGEHTRRQQEVAQLKLQITDMAKAPATELTRLIARQKARMGEYGQVTDALLLEALSEGRINQSEAAELRSRRDQEVAALREMEAEQEKLDSQELSDFRTREVQWLQANAPELANRDAIGKVNTFLIENGAEPDDLTWLTGVGYKVADMARKYAELEAKASTSKPVPVKQGKATPARSANAGDTRARKMAALRRKGTPASLQELVDMQLDDEAEGMGF